MNMQKITWTLNDLNEANAILGVLGKLPYEQVGELIPRLKQQTVDSVRPPADPPVPPKLSVVPDGA